MIGEKMWREHVLRRESFMGGILRLLLFPFAQLFWLGVEARHLLFAWGWLSVERASLPVVSIGNLTMGGVGKTPFTALLARRWSGRHRVAIVLRGYGGSAREATVVTKETLPALCGDEARLLVEQLPEVVVIVAQRRIEGARKAAEEGCTLVLLDDGLQHRALHRDREIVLIEGARPFGSGWPFPMGDLREVPRALRRADLVVVQGGPCTQALDAYTQAPKLFVQRRIEAVIGASGEEVALHSGARVALFCGIGRPEAFVEDVQEQLGLEVVERLFVGDHQAPSWAKVEALAERGRDKGASWLLCTEKDRVKWSYKQALALPLAWVRSRLEITEGEGRLDEIMV